MNRIARRISRRRHNPSAYRSGLEAKIAQQIEDAGHTIRYEQTKLPYILPASNHTYTPDYVLDNGIIVEGKGLFEPQDRKKHLLIKRQLPELDIRFVFSRSASPIYKGSPTRYSDWCNKFGFLYADKTIPVAWFLEEAGISLEALSRLLRR